MTSSALTGKSAATDIVSRKKSLPVLYGLARSDALTQLYAQPSLGDHDVERAITLLDEVGARTYTQQLENEYYQAALTALQKAEPVGQAGQWLYGLTAWLFKRSY